LSDWTSCHAYSFFKVEKNEPLVTQLIFIAKNASLEFWQYLISIQARLIFFKGCILKERGGFIEKLINFFQRPIDLSFDIEISKPPLQVYPILEIL
jgi:hypothetical protein